MLARQHGGRINDLQDLSGKSFDHETFALEA